MSILQAIDYTLLEIRSAISDAKEHGNSAAVITLIGSLVRLNNLHAQISQDEAAKAPA